jgi:large subunit ribosomal protein L21
MGPGRATQAAITARPGIGVSMYAIVETSGSQYRVQKGDKIVVDRVAAEVGATVTLDRVLLLHGDSIQLGEPTVAGASITAKVLSHTLGEKLRSFKYVRTRRYRRRHGYRHHNTTLEILEIRA